MEHLLGGGLFTRSGDDEGAGGKANDTENIQQPIQATVHAYVSQEPLRLRPLGKRKHAVLNDTTSAEFIRMLARPLKQVTKIPAPPRKRKNRPLLTELFRPQRDSDLALYEQHAKHVRTFFSQWSHKIDAEEDELPQKLLIVSGPTGSGKTVTIEVLAQKYGFRLVELAPGERFRADLINATSTASESTGQVPEKVAMQYERHGTSRPWFTSGDKIVWDSRPACVLIDVDGLTGADAQRFQRDILAATFVAKRPIVLVLNNRYAPCVGDLRTRRFVTEAPFYRPALYDLRKHLIKRADRSGIDLKRDLDRVLEACEGDIRASLTALQFSFVHSTGANSGPSAATALLNDKQAVPDLEALGDADLQKLFDRVYDYSLETDVCWDMSKVAEIGEWNMLCDRIDDDGLRRASLLKYRSLFKSGKVLAPRALPNDFEKRQKIRQTLSSCYEASNSLSKRTLRLETLPLVASMCGKTQPAVVAGLLWSVGIRGIEKSPTGYELYPDISEFGAVTIEPAVVTEFELIKDKQKEYTVGNVQRRNAQPAQDRNWLKKSDFGIKKIAAGVWLDFKASDENQAKKPIGLAELLA